MVILPITGGAAPMPVMPIHAYRGARDGLLAAWLPDALDDLLRPSGNRPLGELPRDLPQEIIDGLALSRSGFSVAERRNDRTT